MNQEFLYWSGEAEDAHQILAATGLRGGLWLGNYKSAMDCNFLESRNIKLVLTVAKDLPVKVPSLQIAHVVYEVEDRVTAEIARYFEPAARTIKEGLKRGGVLVHCHAGVSRSCTIVVAFLMQSEGMSLEKALSWVRGRRKVVHPNEGFMKQLEKLELATWKPKPWQQGERQALKRRSLPHVETESQEEKRKYCMGAVKSWRKRM